MVQIHFFEETNNGIQEVGLNSAFAPMVQLIEAAHKLDNRPNGMRKVWFISPAYRNDPIRVYVDWHKRGLNMCSLPLSFEVTIADGKVEVTLTDMNFKMTHKVKMSKFDAMKVLQHFETCVVDALQQTANFRKAYADVVDFNVFDPVMMDITCTNAVEITISADSCINVNKVTRTVPLKDIDELNVKMLVDEVWA